MEEKAKPKKASRIKYFFTFRSIGSKIFLGCLINCIILFIVIFLVMSTSLNNISESIALSAIKSDISQSIMTDSFNWKIINGALYCNDVLIGDGTDDNNNLPLLLNMDEESGSFCYIFMKTDDSNLSWVGDKSTGYEEGHYIRIAGTTQGPDGESLIGTYISKDIADSLDEDGEYSCTATYDNQEFYCYYKTLHNSSGEVIGAMVVGRNMASINKTISGASRSMYVFIAIIIVLTGIIMLLITRSWIKSVNKTQAYIRRIGDGELPDDPLVLNTRNEISEVASRVNNMVESLKERRRIGDELDVARSIQANLLPKDFPAFPERNDFDLYASMAPAKEVGGDFYDFFLTNDNKLVVVIADVSGKGVPAALFMVTARTLIKDRAYTAATSSDVLTSTNKLLCEGNIYGFFVTAWLGIIDLETGDVDFTNAGHNPPLVCHDGKFEYLRSKPDFVLAGMEGMIYNSQHYKLSKGDTLFLYTDGVTEATNSENNLYGEERLLSFLEEKAGTSSMQEVCESLKADVDSFAGDTEQFDDITMLALKYHGGGKAYYETTTVASVANIEIITDFIDERLEKHGASMKTIMQINVAVDEILSNIAFYAYPGNTGSVKVIIEVPPEQDYATLKFVDGGMPYNPLEKEDPDVTLTAEQRKIGGLGIYIVKKTMDNVEYMYKKDKNILTLTKKL